MLCSLAHGHGPRPRCHNDANPNSSSSSQPKQAQHSINDPHITFLSETTSPKLAEERTVAPRGPGWVDWGLAGLSNCCSSGRNWSHLESATGFLLLLLQVSRGYSPLYSHPPLLGHSIKSRPTWWWWLIRITIINSFIGTRDVTGWGYSKDRQERGFKANWLLMVCFVIPSIWSDCERDTLLPITKYGPKLSTTVHMFTRITLLKLFWTLSYLNLFQ